MPPGTDRTRIVSQEAAYWYIRCSDEKAMLHADRQLFFAWLKRSPENIAEMLRISGMDSKFARQRLLDRVGELDESNVVDVDFGGSVSQYDYEPSDVDEGTPRQKASVRRAWAVAAAVAVIAVASLLSLVTLKKPPEGTVETHASQWQHMTLEDGSTVHIDARSRLRVEFGAERRLVHLYEGQAVFDVEKDARRPFVVQTELADVIAVGTRFGVTIDPGVTTTVEEGVVKVIRHGEEDAPPVMVAQNQQYQVLETKLVQLSALDPVRKVDAKRRLMWTTGWIDMEGATIGEVVDEFNRRHSTQAHIDSPEIAARRLPYARLKIDSVEKFSEAMENQEGITTIMDTANKTLHLRPE